MNREVTFWELINLLPPRARICIYAVYGIGTDSEDKEVVYEGLANGLDVKTYEYYAECAVLMIYADKEDSLNAKIDKSGQLVIEYLNEINIEIEYPQKGKQIE